MDCRRALGHGLRGEPRPPLDQVIARINAAPAPKLAVDLPSGLDCDTGAAASQTIRASLTCTFVAQKRASWRRAPQSTWAKSACSISARAEVDRRLASKQGRESAETRHPSVCDRDRRGEAQSQFALPTEVAPSPQQPSPIDDDDRSGHVAGGVAGHVEGQAADLARFSQAAHRDRPFDLRLQFWSLVETSGDWRR